MEKNKKKSRLDWFIKNIIGMEAMLYLGEYILWIFGGFIVIERMIEFYLNFDSSLKFSNIFTICFMIAVMSIPMFIINRMVEKIDHYWKEKKEEK